MTQMTKTVALTIFTLEIVIGIRNSLGYGRMLFCWKTLDIKIVYKNVKKKEAHKLIGKLCSAIYI